MKNIIIITLFILNFNIQYKSQTISLDQISQCESGNCPKYTSIKDTNNRLDKFEGVWKGIYSDGRIYEFHFTKKVDFSLYGGKPSDMIIGRISAKSNNGALLENSLNKQDGETHFNGFEFNKDLTKYQMYYSGNADCNDKGNVYLSFPDPNNINQLKLVFLQDRDIIETCPAGYKTVMPDGKAILLTRQ
jgi:hypothetical protein